MLSRRGLSRPPYTESLRVDELYVMLTMRCNLRCRSCVFWGDAGACRERSFLRRRGAELPLGVLRRVLEEVRPFRPRQVNLAGGEPLLSPNCFPLARYARKLGLPVTLTTNGVLLRRRLREVLECVDQVNLSMDGAPDIAALLRPGAGGRGAGFREILRGLKALSAAKRRGGKNAPLLRVLCAVSSGNYSKLSELTGFLAGAGVRVDEYYFQHLIFNDARTLRRQAAVFEREFAAPLGLWKGYGHVPGPIDFGRFAAELRKLRKAEPGAAFSADLDKGGLERYYTGDRSRRRGGFCLGPWNQPNLLPDGTLWSCPDLPLGDLREASFRELWNGARAVALRRRVQGRLFPACRGCFSYYCGKEDGR